MNNGNGLIVKRGSWHFRRTKIRWYRGEQNQEQQSDWCFEAEGGTGYSYFLSQGKADAWYGFLDAETLYRGQGDTRQTL